MSMQKVNKLYSFFRSSPSSKTRLVFFYRAVSLSLTSLFYLLGPQSPIIFKIGVVTSLVIAAWIITDLQRRYINNSKVLQAIVLTETIGLTLLLIPTGGISSPFIFYALNPVLVAASFLTPLFCLTALTFYLGSATLIAYFLFQIDSMVSILQDKSYFYLICLLTTLLAQLFSGLTRELDSKTTVLEEQQAKLLLMNKKLTETNFKYEDTLEHIMSLYHLMDNFSSKKSPQQLAEQITTSLLKFTQSNEAFVWLTDLNHQNSYISTSTNNPEIEVALMKKWDRMRGNRDSFTNEINNELYRMKIIRTSNIVGVLGVQTNSSSEDNMSFLVNRTFMYLSDLSEIMLERIHLDQVMDQMIVFEEQNRIANEIHDSVSQRLFGIVYSLHSLQVKSQTMTKEQLNEEYQFLSQSANTTIKELRSAIYRLSSVKKGEKPFLARLKKYLDEFAKLNDVDVNYQFTGEEAFISDEVKQALYRVVFESCGNAVRHGSCHSIDINLSLLDERTVLRIKDDGIGFTKDNKSGKKVHGIGLLNMQNIARSLDGIFSIESVNNLGTEIQIDIPNRMNLKEKEVVG